MSSERATDPQFEIESLSFAELVSERAIISCVEWKSAVYIFICMYVCMYVCM